MRHDWADNLEILTTEEILNIAEQVSYGTNEKDAVKAIQIAYALGQKRGYTRGYARGYDDYRRLL